MEGAHAQLVDTHAQLFDARMAQHTVLPVQPADGEVELVDAYMEGAHAQLVYTHAQLLEHNLLSVRRAYDEIELVDAHMAHAHTEDAHAQLVDAHAQTANAHGGVAHDLMHAHVEHALPGVVIQAGHASAVPPGQQAQVLGPFDQLAGLFQRGRRRKLLRFYTLWRANRWLVAN